MSTAPNPSHCPALDLNHRRSCHPTALVPVFVPPVRPAARRATYTQGRALEVLAHAIEYLVDSRMYLVDEPATRADSEATQMLMLLSRQIFSECAEVVSAIHRLKLWIA
jgi:hypothetical protein